MHIRLWQIILIIGATLFITLLHFLTPLDQIAFHQVYQRLYYIPIIVAALWYGWRGGLLAAVFAAVAFAPHVFLHWHHTLYDYALNQYAEIILFLVFGAITGWLGDQNRREKLRTEQINKELQAAYAELRQTVNQLLQAERLSSLGEIAAGVVHEIRNPLGAIKGAVEILEDGLEKNSPRHEFAGIAKQEIDRLNKLVQEFLHFSRPKILEKQETDVNGLLHSVCLLIEKQAATQNARVREDFNQDLPLVRLDPDEIKQVVLNLVLNALQAMPRGGELICRTRQFENKAVIEIEDTGGGVDEKILPNIFDPFFTTKEKGLGLGLSVAYKIVSQHSGALTARSTEKGAVFSISLPISSV